MGAAVKRSVRKSKPKLADRPTRPKYGEVTVDNCRQCKGSHLFGECPQLDDAENRRRSRR